MLCFRYTSSVCKHVVQDGPKYKLQTLVHSCLNRKLMVLPILSVLCWANNFQWRFMTNLTTPKVCGYTTLKNSCFQKMCQQSTVTADQTCGYRTECKHNLKQKHKLNFLAHPVRQYRFLMFTNTRSVSKTKHNLTWKSFQKISFCISIYGGLLWS